MPSLIKALRQQGAPRAELDRAEDLGGDVRAIWASHAHPLLMMRVAAVAGVDPKVSVAIACEATSAVVDYVGPNEPRPEYALAVVRAWLEGRAGAELCGRAGQLAEEVAQAYRQARQDVDKIERRKYRAAAYASFAAARTALAARDAAVTRELDYDADYTFEDAWNGAKVGCALTAGQVLLDAVEAACSASAVSITLSTRSSMAGAAAANDTRPLALAWASRLIRASISVDEVASACASLGP